MTEMEKLKRRLFGPDGIGVANVNIFPGDNPDPEKMAAQLNAALDEIIRGDSQEIEEFDD